MEIKCLDPHSTTLADDSAYEIGHVYAHGRQAYLLCANTPHVRKNGEPTVLRLWATHCAGCGGPFTFTTGRALIPPKRCAWCRPISNAQNQVATARRVLANLQHDGHAS